MTNATPIQPPLLAEITALEASVWEALVSGNAEADKRLLRDDFLGVYPTGVAAREDHCGQLADGPVMQSYAISEAQLRVISPEAVLLIYRAAFQRVGHSQEEVMYITSLWQRGPKGWLNSFSQDTPAA